MDDMADLGGPNHVLLAGRRCVEDQMLNMYRGTIHSVLELMVQGALKIVLDSLLHRRAEGFIIEPLVWHVEVMLAGEQRARIDSIPQGSHRFESAEAELTSESLFRLRLEQCRPKWMNDANRNSPVDLNGDPIDIRTIEEVANEDEPTNEG